MPLLFPVAAAIVATRDIGIKLRNPDGVLQLTKLSDIQRDAWQQEPLMEVMIDVKCAPKSAPATITTVAPVDGTLRSVHEEILGG
jgi:hypothetical protein